MTSGYFKDNSETRLILRYFVLIFLKVKDETKFMIKLVRTTGGLIIR